MNRLFHIWGVCRRSILARLAWQCMPVTSALRKQTGGSGGDQRKTQRAPPPLNRKMLGCVDQNLGSLTLQAWKPTVQILPAKEFNFGC